jgi:hypothetical protein
MKGYCYLSNDGKLVVKNSNYIDEVNPGFFSENKEFVLKVWKFDTDNMRSMLRMYSDFRDLELKRETVRVFSNSIGFAIEKLKEHNESILRRR